MSYIYSIAKMHLKKKDYAECVNSCTTANKVGKEEKAKGMVEVELARVANCGIE